MGAGASCPYGYPSGARLRERIVLSQGLWQSYMTYHLPDFSGTAKESKSQEIREFIDAFDKANIRSIDLFIANNPKLATIGKYIIAFEILRAEQQSLFGEKAKFEREHLAHLQNHQGRSPADLFPQPLFLGGDWYSYLYNRLIAELVGKSTLPDFSNGNLAFITFNYDRSLEYILYDSLRNSFTEVSETDIITCLRKLKILHVYGQVAPLKWQDSEQGIDYRPQISEALLQKTAANIKTMYELKESPELNEAQQLLEQAEQIFFLGFGYAPENMGILGLPMVISPPCFVYGTGFNLIAEEIHRVYIAVHGKRKLRGNFASPTKIGLGDVDCFILLRKYLN